MSHPVNDLLTHLTMGSTAGNQSGAAAASGVPAAPQLQLLDFFFPGFSIFSGAIHKYLHIDLNLYIPLVLLFGALVFAWQYFSDYTWGVINSYLMSTVDIRTDDELYNYVMAWVAAQRFSKGARRFIANTDLNSRSWFLFRWDSDDNEDEADEGGQKKKPLAYTPTFGSHYFWYRGRLLIFRRNQNREQAFIGASEREEISLCCFGRDPWALKELLYEARDLYVKRDESKTLIYRGSTKGSSSEPSWQRCMSRTSRPFSTVILNEKVKRDLIDDVTDYLDPATRRWYANRGIPYRRGYLLHGPPGTGKSSLSLALAGFFKMRIYIVSLSSVTSSEENLGSLFAELPRRCVVLLEDIDTAGLTHTRDDANVPEVAVAAPADADDDMVPGQKTPGIKPAAPQSSGRLSLSGLLNILDGVASQEGRVLIMTTNHLEKLDKALIRPGRVDMIVKFDRADQDMTAAIFRAIFAPLEGDDVDSPSKEAPIEDKVRCGAGRRLSGSEAADAAAAAEKAAAAAERARAETVARVERLAGDFAREIPALEFSPAELQGFLLKNKRNPEAAVKGAAEWVVEKRREREEKEIKEAEEKRKAAAEEEAKKKKKAEEEKEKEAEKEKEKEKERRKKEKREAKRKARKGTKKHRRAKDGSDSSAASDASSDSGSASDSEAEERVKKPSLRSASSKIGAEILSVKAAASPEGADLGSVKLADKAAQETGTAAKTLSVDEGKNEGDSGYGTP